MSGKRKGQVRVEKRGVRREYRKGVRYDGEKSGSSAKGGRRDQV